MDNRQATQSFAVRTLLTAHCMEVLTPDRIDQIMQEIDDEMRNGACAWAFAPQSQQP